MRHTQIISCLVLLLRLMLPCADALAQQANSLCTTSVQLPAPYNVERWTDKKRDESGSELPRYRSGQQQLAGPPPGVAIEASYVPGMQFPDYSLFEAGKLIPANVDLDIQVHYTPNGKEVIDRPQVGFVLAKKEPKSRYISYAISAPTDAGFPKVRSLSRLRTMTTPPTIGSIRIRTERCTTAIRPGKK